MINKKYYEGYEGEGAVKVWVEEDGKEKGMVIWIGFFDTILDGCFNPEYKKDGIIECYNNLSGFYVDKWKIKYPQVVLEELNEFNEDKVDTNDEEIIKICREINNQLINCISVAAKNGNSVYVEYE